MFDKYLRSDTPESSMRLSMLIIVLSTVPIQLAVAFHIIYMTLHYGVTFPIVEVLNVLKGVIAKGASLSEIPEVFKSLPVHARNGIEWIGVAAFETAMAGLYLGLLYGKKLNKAEEVKAGETSADSVQQNDIIEKAQ